MGTWGCSNADVSEFSFINDTSNKIGKFNVYRDNYYKIAKLENDLYNLIYEYTYYMWDLQYTYVIRVSFVDLMNEYDYSYFMYRGSGLYRLDNQYGEEIFSEWFKILGNHEESFDIKWNSDTEEFDAEPIFKRIVNKLREKDLFVIDTRTNENLLYGEFEPE
ncbi:MAG: hypothetical protein NC489_44220 [Ruminococcus flavefaciens]|nr:hypothetical protein [Ruminococcus flavefaciens]